MIIRTENKQLVLNEQEIKELCQVTPQWTERCKTTTKDEYEVRKEFRDGYIHPVEVVVWFRTETPWQPYSNPCEEIDVKEVPLKDYFEHEIWIEGSDDGYQLDENTSEQIIEQIINNF